MSKRSAGRLFQLPESWETGLSKLIHGKHFEDRLLEQKQEAFNRWADNLPKFRLKGKEQTPKDNVVRVLSFPEVTPSGKQEMIKEFDFTHNLVTNDGELYYARQAANEAHAANEDFGDTTARFDQGTTAYAEAETDTYNEYDVAGTSSIAGSIVAFTGTYPKTNDTGDADNTGDSPQAVSYAVNYSAVSFGDNDIEQGAIHENASPVTTTKLLAVWSYTSFAKTTADTLKVFVNHTFENQ